MHVYEIVLISYWITKGNTKKMNKRRGKEQKQFIIKYVLKHFLLVQCIFGLVWGYFV